MDKPKIYIVTPVKNEEQFIRYTLESVIAQTVLPSRWIIVDDGSSDKTATIVREYCARHPWISIVTIDSQGEERRGGSKVVRAFNRGFSEIRNEAYDYIVKLDGDLTLPPDYFEKMLQEFSRSPRLGICGGRILNKFSPDDLREEKSEEFHVRGALKMLRRKCWEEIGGFKTIWNWDGLDIIEARYKGWVTRSVNVPVIHHRPTSSAYDAVGHAYKSGYESYRMGADLLLTLLRALIRVRRKPFFKVGLAFLKGYSAARHSNAEKVISGELARFSNKLHYSRFNIFAKKQKWD